MDLNYSSSIQYAVMLDKLSSQNIVKFFEQQGVQLGLWWTLCLNENMFLPFSYWVFDSVKRFWILCC